MLTQNLYTILIKSLTKNQVIEMDRKVLTREKLSGMQVINGEGYFVGRVKDICLIVNNTCHAALLIENAEGQETEILLDEISAIGDAILLKQKLKQKSVKNQISHCPSCGTELDADALFCPECGKKIR